MKKGMGLIIVGLLAAITAIYLLFIRKSTKNTNNITASDSLNGGKNETNSSMNTGTGTNTGTGANTTTIINIKNPKFAPSPLIGQGHLTAEIEIVNPPQQGNLTILLSNTFVNEVNLPLSNGKYILDQYVAFSNTMTYNLTAKIGTVTKTVQVSF